MSFGSRTIVFGFAHGEECDALLLVVVLELVVVVAKLVVMMPA